MAFKATLPGDATEITKPTWSGAGNPGLGNWFCGTVKSDEHSGVVLIGSTLWYLQITSDSTSEWKKFINDHYDIGFGQPSWPINYFGTITLKDGDEIFTVGYTAGGNAFFDVKRWDYTNPDST